MSRAFVKETDEPEPRLQREPGRPITPAGLEHLRAAAEAEPDTERRAQLENELNELQVVGPPDDRSRIAFGARVRVREASGAEREFTIVGDDEVDPAHGFIGAHSPLAVALMGKKAGSAATWERPAGTMKLKVLEVAYEPRSSHAA